MSLNRNTWCRHSIRKMVSASRRIFFVFVMTLLTGVLRSFNPSNKAPAVVIQYGKWSVHQGAYFSFVHVSFGFSMSIVYPPISTYCGHSMWKMINALRRIFFCFMSLLASLFRLFTTQNKHSVWSFNKKIISASRRMFFVF